MVYFFNKRLFIEGRKSGNLTADREQVFCVITTSPISEGYVPHVTPMSHLYCSISDICVVWCLYTVQMKKSIWVRCDEVSKPSWCSFPLSLMGFFLTVKVQITTAAHTLEHRDSALTLTPLLTKSSVAFEAQLLFSLHCLRKGLRSSKSNWGWSKREKAKEVDDITNTPASGDASELMLSWKTLWKNSDFHMCCR